MVFWLSKTLFVELLDTLILFPMPNSVIQSNGQLVVFVVIFAYSRKILLWAMPRIEKDQNPMNALSDNSIHRTPARQETSRTS